MSKKEDEQQQQQQLMVRKKWKMEERILWVLKFLLLALHVNIKCLKSSAFNNVLMTS